MENLVLIQEVGAYSERQYQKQDGSTEYFKSRGVIMKHGGDIFYGEMTGDYASKNRETQRTWEDQNHQTRHENMFYISDIQAL